MPITVKGCILDELSDAKIYWIFLNYIVSLSSTSLICFNLDKIACLLVQVPLNTSHLK